MHNRFRLNHNPFFAMPSTAALPTNITFHGLDRDLATAFRDYAAKAGKSLNAAGKELLRRALGLPTAKEKEQVEAWSRFIGSLSDEDAAEMRETLKAFEQIDEEMWK